VTGYNFLEMNILHGLSKTFGEDDFWWYFIVQLPINLNILFPFSYIGCLYTHPRC
jgi:Alg9-like mannosyltransferase family